MEQPLPDFYDHVYQYQFDEMVILLYLWAMNMFHPSPHKNKGPFKKTGKVFLNFLSQVLFAISHIQH